MSYAIGVAEPTSIMVETYGTGKVSGKIRYGKLVVEEGGQLSGEIAVGVGTSASARPAAAARSVEVPVPAVALA